MYITILHLFVRVRTAAAQKLFVLMLTFEIRENQPRASAYLEDSSVYRVFHLEGASTQTRRLPSLS